MAQDIEKMQIMGMDPMVVMGLITIASAAGGWLLGPAVLGNVFKLMHRKYMWAVEQVMLLLKSFPLPQYDAM